MSVPEQKWEALRGLMEERDRVVNKLERSFMLQRLWPNAFSHGQGCKTVVTGNPFDLLIFKIIREDGSEQHFPMDEVRIELWPGQVLKDVRNVKGIATPYLARLRRYVNQELARISG